MLELHPGEIGLFGYGSLLLQSSMECTLGRRYEGDRFICHLKNWRRTWDSLYPNSRFYFITANGDRCYPKNILYLNVVRAPGLLNGVVYAISEDDLLEFDRREAYYSRIDIANEVPDLRVRGGPVFLYTGRAPYVLQGGASITDVAIRRSYLNLIEQGLENLGPDFRRAFETSTDQPSLSNVIDDRID